MIADCPGELAPRLPRAAIRRLSHSPAAVLVLLTLAALPNLRLPPRDRLVERDHNLDGLMKLRGIQADPSLRAALGYFMGDDPQRVHTFRPLPAFTLWVDYHLFGYLEWPYVLISWLWFVATGAVLWRLCLRLGLPDWGAVATAAIAMGLVTRGTKGTIPYIAARHDVVCVLFAVLALWFLFGYLQTPRRRALLAYVLAALASYLSKEMAVALAPIGLGLVAWHWRHGTPRRAVWLAAAATVGAALIWFVWYRLAEGHMGPGMATHTTADWARLLGERWPRSLVAALFHLSRPVGELMGELAARLGWSALWYAPFWRALFLLALQVACVAVLWRHRPLWLFTLYLWKAASWVPVLPLNVTWPWYEYMPHMLDPLLGVGTVCAAGSEWGRDGWRTALRRLSGWLPQRGQAGCPAPGRESSHQHPLNQPQEALSVSTDRYAIGLDFGTNSVRALIADVSSGEEVATAVSHYKRGDAGIIGDPSNPHVARQHPADYHECMIESVQEALAAAQARPGFRADQIIGLGVDTTGSTPLPVNCQGVPLALLPDFADNPNAMAWLWKDHSSMAQAERLTEIAARERPQVLCRSGGTYSSEWFWSKIWHCLNAAPEVFAAAHSWVECCDYIPALLVGNTDPATLKRGICSAGHKAAFSEDWGGLPDVEFLATLDPKLAALRGRLFDAAYPSSVLAGGLCAEWAGLTGLPEGLPVAVGGFDAHYGAVASGVAPGTLVKILGTSSCDITVAPKTGDPLDIPGVCGLVEGSVLPGVWGIEAGQCAVGDIYNWFVSNVCEAEASYHETLAREAQALKPGESGLLALDWNNGNRCVLVDARLTGLLIGQTLATTRAEIYRALIEATAMGALTIHNRLQDCGVPIRRIVLAGGIAEKNPFLMQLYADVIGQTLEVSQAAQTCALGAAIFGAVVAGPEAGGYATVEEAQAQMTGIKDLVFQPNPAAHAVYQELYPLYLKLHDSFGIAGTCADVSDVMKRLLDIKQRVSGA